MVASHYNLPGIGIYCPKCPLGDWLYLFCLSVSDVRESTIGSEKIVTNATPTIRNEDDFKNIFHLGSCSDSS